MTLPAGWNANPQSQDPADDVLPGAGELPGPHATTMATPIGGTRGVATTTDASITAVGATFNGTLQSAMDAAMSFRDDAQLVIPGAQVQGTFTPTNRSPIGNDYSVPVPIDS